MSTKPTLPPLPEPMPMSMLSGLALLEYTDRCMKAYGEACWNAALAASPPQEAQPTSLDPAAPAYVPLSESEVRQAMDAPLDALLDHIYEHGTAAEGIMARATKLARSIESLVVARMRGEGK